MDFSLTVEQKMIKDSARNFLEKECPSDLIREMEEDEKGYSSDLWRKIARLGWLGLIFPIEYGGSGGSFLDLVVLVEEMGRYLVPVPFIPTVIFGGLSILSTGSEEQRQEFLPKIINGELILTMALTELNPSFKPSGIEVQAFREGHYFLINGTKFFVPYAHVADYLVCAARTQSADKIGEGISLFLIDGKNSNLRYTVLKTIAGDKPCEVVLNRVRLPEKNLLGGVNKGWEVIKKILEQGTLVQCALMVGGAEKVLEMTVAHAKKRVQFNRPIGSFQAIQHKCANMKVDLDGARFATYEAAWKISCGLSPVTLEVSVAKAWVNQAYQRICANGHQAIGGIGAIKDHDMHLYSRRAKAEEFLWGDTNFHREVVAQQLGL